MNLRHYGRVGGELRVVVDPAGRLRDLWDHCAGVGIAELSPEGLARLAAPEIGSLLSQAPRSLSLRRSYI